MIDLCRVVYLNMFAETFPISFPSTSYDRVKRSSGHYNEADERRTRSAEEGVVLIGKAPSNG